MMFFIRTAFWLTIVLLLLPADPNRPPDVATQQPSTAATLSAAQAALSDAQGFCARQQEACAVGGKLVQSLGEKAQYGARLVYEYLTAQFGDGTAAPTVRPLPSADSVTTGSVVPARTPPARDTLTALDTLTVTDRTPPHAFAPEGSQVATVPMPVPRPQL
jgi:hypothetical protein